MRPSRRSANRTPRSGRDQEDSISSSSPSPTRADFEESDFYVTNNDSSSSIGVPIYQDMDITKRPSGPPVDRLPAEILIQVFERLHAPQDLLSAMCVNRKWARNSVQKLWHRPGCTNLAKLDSIGRSLALPDSMFDYRHFVKRLNLAVLHDRVDDRSLEKFFQCNQIERLTLTSCQDISDQGLIGILNDSTNLLALDVSGVYGITSASIEKLADTCKKLQGLNISSCNRITNESLERVAENCRLIKRLKLNDCSQLDDSAVRSFAQNCRNILEMDLHGCKMITNSPITALLEYGQSLRELRLANCELISDGAFLNVRSGETFEHLRILDLTSCARITDLAVRKIISVAPRLRNLVLAKCRNITDVAVNAISQLGKNLHYVHLGHCAHITDEAIIRLVRACNRIRYIDLGCCTKLTDLAVKELAKLPKLRRIGLVKCDLITDEAIYALAKNDGYPASVFNPPRKQENYPADGVLRLSSLERVHLSYCTKLTIRSVMSLLNKCPRLTHLSLTGVEAFLRNDLEVFCRQAPPEFTPHQREVFCVFSGSGVSELRTYLNGPNPEQATTDDDELYLRPGSFMTRGQEDRDEEDPEPESEEGSVTGPSNLNAHLQPPPPPPPPSVPHHLPLHTQLPQHLSPSSSAAIQPPQPANSSDLARANGYISEDEDGGDDGEDAEERERDRRRNMMFANAMNARPS